MGYDNAPGAPPRFMNSVHGRVVFGGTFPATIWHKYMQGITDGMDVGTFADPKSFPGKVLNSNLATTTTTAPRTSQPSATTTPGSTTSSTASTTPDSTTSTPKAQPSTTAAAPAAGPGP
jgi:membrane peptidoglycan carboxypeptidase